MKIMTDKKKTILEAVEKLTDTYRKEELFLGRDRERLPNKKEIINFIKDMRSIIFPGYFSVDSSASVFPEHYVAYRLNDLYDCLQEQIEIAFLYQGEEEQKAKEHTEQITERFFANVPEIQRMLLTDLQASTGTRLPRVKKRLFSLILDFMRFMYTDWLMFCIWRMCRLFRELCLNMHMVIQGLILTRVRPSENISLLTTEPVL